jgi:hypothetical protein
MSSVRDALSSAGSLLALVFLCATAHAEEPLTRAPPPAKASPHVWLTLTRTHQNARLEERSIAIAMEPAGRVGDDDRTEDDRWRTLCEEPCGTWVAAGSTLRVNGDFPESAPFTVPARPAVVVRAKPPAGGSVGGSVALIATSGSILLVTAAIGVLLHSGTAEDSRNAEERARNKHVDRVLLGVGGVSLGGLVAGIFLLRSVRRTDIELRSAATTSTPTPARIGSEPPRIALGRGFAVSGAGIHF